MQCDLAKEDWEALRKPFLCPLGRLSKLDGRDTPWVSSGPVGPRNMIVLGAWFMMREIEAANARVKDVVVHVHGGRPKVVWSLPASKTDQKACGVSRSHGCICDGTPLPSCPGHAAWAQASLLRRLFPHLSDDMPFFPNSVGKVCTKEAMAGTVSVAAVSLGVPTETATGKITGHTLRVTGAQGMAAAGLDLWAVQLLGRWGSAAVKGYVRDAHLAQAEAWAMKVKRNQDLDEMAAEIASKVEEQVMGSKRWAELLKKAEEKIEEIKSAAPQVEVAPEAAEALAVEALVTSRPAPADKLDTVTSVEGVVHEVLLGPPEVDLATAVSACGWRFGMSASARLTTRGELPAVYKRLCARCFPLEREQGKEAAKQQAARL